MAPRIAPMKREETELDNIIRELENEYNVLRGDNESLESKVAALSHCKETVAVLTRELKKKDRRFFENFVYRETDANNTKK